LLSSLELARANINDPVLSEVAPKFHKYLDDNNPSALEKAVELIDYYIQNGGAQTYETSKLIKNLLEKGLSSKQSIKERTMDLLNFLFVKGQKEELFSCANTVITKNLTVPKYPLGVYELLKSLLEKHGPQKMDMLKPFIQSTVKAAGSVKPQVKDAVGSGHPGHRLLQRVHDVDRSQLPHPHRWPQQDPGQDPR
jgi:hypothetical protein